MNVLFVGGGTLGSLNPLVAVAKKMQQLRPDVAVAFWVSTQPLDARILVEAGFAFRTIPSGKFRRYFSLRTVVDALIIPVTFFYAAALLMRLRPRLVVSAGSYVAVPVSFAAWCLRIPVLIYQQDVELGLANRMMSWVARERTATTPARAALFGKPAQVVGFALREDIAQGDPHRARVTYGLEPSWKTLLVIGGSSGALRMNTLFLDALPLLPQQLNILHITGSGKAKPVHRAHYVALPFTNASLPDLYAVADVILSRAGSNVLAEVLAVKKPCIIIPLPGTHQEANARELENLGARVAQETSLTPTALAEQVTAMLSQPLTLAFPSTLEHAWDVRGTEKLALRITRYL